MYLQWSVKRDVYCVEIIDKTYFISTCTLASFYICVQISK